MEKLSGKSAVITGATGGIGHAIALALAEAGADLHLVGRNRDALERIARDMAKKANCRIDVDECDLADSERLDPDLGTLTDAPIDILVHSAGAFVLSNIADTTLESQNEIFNVNYRSPVALTRLLLPSLRDAGGTVVFLNSSVCQQPGKPGLAAYTASKLALKAFADSLRAEENGNGVRVVTVYPGRTASGMQERIHQAEGKDYVADRLLQCSDVAASVLHALTLPATAEITDIEIRPFLKS